ncbi:LOW QUALITY PROTEIN: hypothetical protein RJ641_035515 [Dillenia turbinata]|uniref:Uncharacterized protein n=1 Tax=Dillenia turbinata TaxID=194707 RepID=A0AAN8VJR7_9MAGN
MSFSKTLLTSSFLLIVLFFTITTTNAANFLIRNNCHYTVWAASVPAGGGRQLNSGQEWTPLPAQSEPVYELAQAATLTGQAEAGAKPWMVSMCLWNLSQPQTGVLAGQDAPWTLTGSARMCCELQADAITHVPFLKLLSIAALQAVVGPLITHSFSKRDVPMHIATLRMIKLVHLRALGVPITGLCSALEWTLPYGYCNSSENKERNAKKEGKLLYQD